MDAETKKLAAQIYAELAETCLPKKPEVVPQAPAPRVVAREVEVSPRDKNYSAATGGKVHVDIYEKLYWNAVDRAFAKPAVAEVVSAYDPFAKSRMPGFDPGEDR